LEATIYRIRVAFTGVSGTPWVATHYFNEAAGTAQAAANAVGVFWGTVDNQMNNLVNWATEADVALIDIPTGALTSVQSTTPQTGTGASATGKMALVAQGLLRWRTNSVVNGRNLRGRTFIPGLVTSVSNDGQVAVANQTSINGAGNALIADASSDLVIWHRPTESAPASGVAGSATVATMWTQFAELRTRRD
jgi:hypothetical protein